MAALGYTRLGCVRPQQLSTPPGCLDGQADGTLVDSFLIAGCDGGYERPDFAERVVRNSLLPARLLAVGSPSSQAGGDGTQYVLLFAYDESAESPGFWWAVREGKIIGYHQTCGSAADAMPVESGTKPTGDAALDHLIGATLTGDKDALVAAAGGSKLGCVGAIDGLGSPPLCLPGEAEGTLVDSFEYGGCDGSFIRAKDGVGVVRGSPTPARLFVAGTPRLPQDGDADHLLLFTYGVTGASASRGFMWHVHEGKIVGYTFSCNDIRELLAFVNKDYLVAPPP